MFRLFKGFFAMMALTATLLAGAAAVGADDFKQIVVATGSPYELGLVQKLAEAFTKQTGCVVRGVKTPTKPGLDLGRHGLAHITMGHSHKATAQFIKEGNAAKHADLMYNLTVIVGPKDDPAKIKGMDDLQTAHKKIAVAKAKYLSRGDRGGMHLLELSLWKKLGVSPDGKPWYEESRKFMLKSLLDANANGQYHMLDSSTWAMYKSQTPDLELMVSGPRNEYEICLVSIEKHPNLDYNQKFAAEFYEFCLSEAGQKLISDFGKDKYGESIYFSWPKK